MYAYAIALVHIEYLRCAPVYPEMPFTDQAGSIFNCGFCRTLVYECLPKRAPKKPTKKEDKSDCNGQGHATTTDVDEASSCSDTQSPQEQVTCSVETTECEKSENMKVCVDAGERYRELFNSAQFVLGETFFTPASPLGGTSQFDRLCKKVRDAFMHGFRSSAVKERYVKAFSSEMWEELAIAEKSRHSLSNCVACATQFKQLQESFPMKPVFRPPLRGIENLYQREMNAAVLQATGKSFAELAAIQGYKSPAEVKKIVHNAEIEARQTYHTDCKSAAEIEQLVHVAKRKCIRETQEKCTAHLSQQLDDSAIQAVYATNVSFSMYDKLRKNQFFSQPSGEPSTKRRFPLRPHECDRFDELQQTLRDWDPAKPFIAAELAKEFDILGTDSSHRIRLLAQVINPTIPGLEIVSKPKSTVLKYPDTGKPMAVGPSKKQLAKLDRSLVDNGTLKEGVPCIPVKIRRFRDGQLVEIETTSRKFPLVEVRQSLLNDQEQLMRLHSDGEIDSMSKDDVLSILQTGAQYSKSVFANATVEDLKGSLRKFERNRTIWFWHDHSSLASHGVLAVMVGVVYDSLVFKTENEMKQGVQEYVEEGAIHMLAHCSALLEDEATLIPERLAELDGLTDEVTSSSGIKIVDTLRFFKGDKPAAQFESGVSCGGNYPCVGCTCHRDRFADFPHTVMCEQRSLKGIQEVALAGHFGKFPGKLKFYEDLSSDQLRQELEKRALKEYPTDKKGRLATLKQVLHGVQRVPSLLLFAPETALSELHLSSYCVLPCEPLHDFKGYLAIVLRKLPSILPQSTMKSSVSDCVDMLYKKSKVYGSDLRSTLVDVAHIFAKSMQGPQTKTIFDFVSCLVQISRILYSKDSDRSPKQCLQFYNCAFMLHQLHCDLFGESTSIYFHALLTHCPVQHEVVCSRSTNTEAEERIFKSAEAAAKCTDRKPENMLPAVLKRLQYKRSSKFSDPLQSLKVENSRISRSAVKLPPFKGTVFNAIFVRKHSYAYQAHLQRIGHYLVLGEGVWWHRTTDGSVHFHDGNEHAEFLDAGPELLHFRNAEVLDAVRRSNACWQEAVARKVPLPVDVVRCYNSCGDVTAVVDTEENSILSEPEMSFDGSFMQPTFPPPQSSTPVRQRGVCEATAAESPESSEVHDAIQSIEQCVQEDESMQPVDNEEHVQPLETDGFVDMAVKEVSESPHSTMQSTVCKAVARLLGVTPELEEFDRVRSVCKSLGKRMAPSILEKYKSLARYFRKKIYLHKRSLERMQLSPFDVGYKECMKDLECCLQLMCNLQ